MNNLERCDRFSVAGVREKNVRVAAGACVSASVNCRSRRIDNGSGRPGAKISFQHL